MRSASCAATSRPQNALVSSYEKEVTANNTRFFFVVEVADFHSAVKVGPDYNVCGSLSSPSWQVPETFAHGSYKPWPVDLRSLGAVSYAIHTGHKLPSFQTCDKHHRPNTIWGALLQALQVKGWRRSESTEAKDASPSPD